MLALIFKEFNLHTITGPNGCRGSQLKKDAPFISLRRKKSNKVKSSSLNGTKAACNCQKCRTLWQMQFNSCDYLNQTPLCMTLSKSSISSEGISISFNTMDLREGGKKKHVSKEKQVRELGWENKYNLEEYAIT